MYQMISRFLKCIGDSLSCFVARLDVSAVIVNDPNRRVPWVGPRRKGNMRYHPDSCTCIDRLSWLQAWCQNYRTLPTHDYIRILYSVHLAMHTTEVLLISLTTRSATSQQKKLSSPQKCQLPFKPVSNSGRSKKWDSVCPWTGACRIQNEPRTSTTHPEPGEENPPLIKLYKNE